MSARPPITELDRLVDVSITSPANGQGLIFNSGTVKWQNLAIPGGTLDSLSDVMIGTPIDKQVLVYSVAGAGWINYGPLAFSDITGNIAISQLNNGTDAAINTYWRGDNTWSPIAAAGTVQAVSTILQGDGAGNAIVTTPALSIASTGLSTSASTNGTFYVDLTNSSAGIAAQVGTILRNVDGNAYVALTGSGVSSGVGPDVLVINNSISAKNLVLATNAANILFSNNQGTTTRATIGAGLGVGVGDPGSGYVNTLNGYQINSATLAQVYNNGSAAGATGFATNAAIPGSVITIPAGAWKVGGAYHCVFDMTKTGAGTAGIVITVHMGTLGTTSDPSVGTVTFSAGTANSELGFFDVYITFKSVGSGTSAVILMAARETGLLLTTGLTSVPNIIATSAGFNSTTQTKISLGFNGGASFSGTNTFVQTEYKQ